MSDELELSGKNRERLAEFVKKIEDLDAEKVQASEAIKAAYAEAASSGFDKKSLRQLIKERKADVDATVMQRRTVGAYRRALGSLTGTPLGEWAQRWASLEADGRLEDSRATYEAGSRAH